MKLSIEHSFPDGEITKWESTNDTLRVEISIVHFDDSVHENAKLRFSDIRKFTCMHWDNEEWIEDRNIEPLKDICELHHKLNKFSIKGFGRNSGLWTAVGIITEHAEIEW